jgi:hypothetical protein
MPQVPRAWRNFLSAAAGQLRAPPRALLTMPATTISVTSICHFIYAFRFVLSLYATHTFNRIKFASPACEHCSNFQSFHLLLSAMVFELTESEAQRYDRQIRVWGAEAQSRIQNSKVLVCGLSKMNVEVGLIT